MRTIIDEKGIPATIYDEYSHPKGLFYNKAVKVEEKKVVVPAKVVVKPFEPVKKKK